MVCTTLENRIYKTYTRTGHEFPREVLTSLCLRCEHLLTFKITSVHWVQ